jgi:hypothetical protein
MNTKQGTWDAASDAVKQVFADCNPQPRAGEHVPCRHGIYSNRVCEICAEADPLIAERDSLAAQLETCTAAHMSNCLDADKLRTRIAELREVLEHVCDTISGPAPALRRARGILAKHGR